MQAFLRKNTGKKSSEGKGVQIITCRRIRRSIRGITYSAGQSPIDVTNAYNYKEEEHKSWVKPIISSIVYRTEDIQKAFFLLLLLVIIGEFFSAPAITLADSAVITLLGEDVDRYMLHYSE